LTAGARGGPIALIMVVALSLGPVDASRYPRRAPHADVRWALVVNGAPAEAAALLRRVARILDVELGLPLPARIVARVYDGPAHFNEGLVTDAAVSVEHAAELAQFAIGAAVPGEILVLAPAGVRRSTVDWPRLIAHELTHLAQIELAATDTGPAQWLREGMAEWVAYQVLQRLGLDDFRMRRAMAQAAAVEYIGRARGLNLDALATPRGFIAQHRRIGTLLTYRLALHLTDELVVRHGFRSLVRYFGAFRYSDDASHNFAVTFTASPTAFARAVLTRLRPSAQPTWDANQLGPQPHHAEYRKSPIVVSVATRSATMSASTHQCAKAAAHVALTPGSPPALLAIDSPANRVAVARGTSAPTTTSSVRSTRRSRSTCRPGDSVSLCGAAWP
jgi:hypothetical protein